MVEQMWEMKVQVIARAVFAVTCRFFVVEVWFEEFGNIDLIFVWGRGYGEWVWGKAMLR
jgi:hypothetical protein